MSLGLRIVFMGTPEFAVASLDAMVNAGYQVVGVITAPDRGVGRGQRIQESAVKVAAMAHGIRVLQPSNLKDVDFINELAALKADLQVVVAFRMLPEVVWGMPPKGTINLHASLLPDYRGAAPINWAIMNGDDETGLTTFIIEKEIDTGKVILQKKVKIPSDWSAGDLHDDLMKKGGELIVETLKLIQDGEVLSVEQDHLGLAISNPRPAPKIFKEDCRINWNKTAEEVNNHIRGLSPYPAAWSELISPDGKSYSIKIFKSAIKEGSGGNSGTLQSDGKSSWKVNCGTGSVELLLIQLAGKKRMEVSDFLRGFELNKDWLLK